LDYDDEEPSIHLEETKKGGKRFVPPNLVSGTSNVYTKGDNKQTFREGKGLVLPLMKIECK
jgi:hypothetical protein